MAGLDCLTTPVFRHHMVSIICSVFQRISKHRFRHQMVSISIVGLRSWGCLILGLGVGTLYPYFNRIFLAQTIFKAPKLSILSSPWRLLVEIAFRPKSISQHWPPPPAESVGCIPSPTPRRDRIRNIYRTTYHTARAFQPRLTTAMTLTNTTKLFVRVF